MTFKFSGLTVFLCLFSEWKFVKNESVISVADLFAEVHQNTVKFILRVSAVKTKKTGELVLLTHFSYSISKRYFPNDLFSILFQLMQNNKRAELRCFFVLNFASFLVFFRSTPIPSGYE